MKLRHNFILCSACNSQMNRDIKAADKDKKFIIISPSPTDESTPQPSTPIIASIPSEFKLRLTIKQNKQVLPSVIVNFNLENPNFIDFRNKLESYICDQIGLVYHNEYTLAYKSH